jgi:hypothetical protein
MTHIDAPEIEMDPKFWRPLEGSCAQHADTTDCQYREVLKYPGNTILQSEEVVTEASLESWLTKVCLLGPANISHRLTENQDLTIESGSEQGKLLGGLRLL